MYDFFDQRAIVRIGNSAGDYTSTFEFEVHFLNIFTFADIKCNTLLAERYIFMCGEFRWASADLIAPRRHSIDLILSHLIRARLENGILVSSTRRLHGLQRYRGITERLALKCYPAGNCRSPRFFSFCSVLRRDFKLQTDKLYQNHDSEINSNHSYS